MAGWICILLGYLTFWIIGFGFLFFSVTIILAVVAMCTNHVGHGIALLVTSIASIAICLVLFFVVIVGTIGAAAQKSLDASKSHPQIQQLPQMPKVFQSPLSRQQSF